MDTNMEELRNIASRLHCIASQMIDAGHFCPTLERAEIRVKKTGEEIGSLVNAINAELAKQDIKHANECNSGDVLRSIAKRYEASYAAFFQREMTPAELVEHHIDERALARWAVSELARRDAEQAERERPIDEEWLRSKWPVVRNDATGFGVNVGIGNVILDRLPNSSGNACVNLSKKNVVLDRCCVVLVTRGQLLDLLNALRGGAT